jgi:hypothetical protein
LALNLIVTPLFGKMTPEDFFIWNLNYLTILPVSIEVGYLLGRRERCNSEEEI